MNAYVYYKTLISDEIQVRSCISEFHRLCTECGLRFQLQKKVQANSEKQPELHTWMEIYTSISIAEAAWQQLEQLVNQSGLHSYIQGTRHVELFEEVALCV